IQLVRKYGGSPTGAHRPGPPPPGMALIDVGTIEVGRNADEIERECREIGAGCDRELMQREIPRRKVTVPAFFLDRDEVTNAQFAKLLNDYIGMVVVTDDEDYHKPRFVHLNRGSGDRDVLYDLNDWHGGSIDYVGTVDHHRFVVRPGRDLLPAAQMSWYGAKLYCESVGKRLPTEDEWEAAARGRDDRRFPWGNALPRCGDVVIANDGKLAMSGSCPPGDVALRAIGASLQDITPDGVRGLAGGVSEWTSSLYVEGVRSVDPGSVPRETPRVFRGASWATSLMARSSGRSKRPPSIMGANIGLRCASSVEGSRPGGP
ncbi:MAG TPA: SUMF1/EgtB/PvdO family nonheme iron enzyme, partial [Kofleriaceae bacterium]